MMQIFANRKKIREVFAFQLSVDSSKCTDDKLKTLVSTFKQILDFRNRFAHGCEISSGEILRCFQLIVNICKILPTLVNGMKPQYLNDLKGYYAEFKNNHTYLKSEWTKALISINVVYSTSGVRKITSRLVTSLPQTLSGRDELTLEIKATL